MKDYMLRVENIIKEFPGVRALNNVSFNVESGSVHSLMGENGAGKSTLMKCLFGIYNKDYGKFFLEGKEINFKNAKEALTNGVAMVQQELNQAITRSVMDNLWLGRYPKRFGVLVNHAKMFIDTKKIFDELGININPKTIMRELSVSQRQLVEIAKAYSYNAKVIVFDEPTSSLTDVEIEKLFSIIDKLKKRGCGIIYISHKMDEILKISDFVTVLRDGSFIATNSAKNLKIEDIIKQMVGRDLSNVYPPKTNTPSDVILKVNSISTKYSDRVNKVSFELRKGEILGIAGLVGAGRSELVELIFGARTLDNGGQIFLHNKKINNKTPRAGIKNGFALITEERRLTGIFGQLTLVDNTVSANYNKYLRRGFLSNKNMIKDTKDYISALKVKTPGYTAKIKNLSGGNQQKVIIGRWLNTTPEILLMDEPTRGIDVGAKYEIYQLLINLANQGKGVVVISSEMPELIGITDRIMVMSNGRLAGIVDTKDTNQEEIMALAAKYV